jgi:hypothetical protein
MSVDMADLERENMELRAALQEAHAALCAVEATCEGYNSMDTADLVGAALKRLQPFVER